MFELYAKEKCLDKGNNYVFEARNRKDDSYTECLKEVRISEADGSYEQFINETSILEKTKLYPHPNMVKYLGYYILKDFANENSLLLIGIIVMEKGK